MDTVVLLYISLFCKPVPFAKKTPLVCCKLLFLFGTELGWRSSRHQGNRHQEVDLPPRSYINRHVYSPRITYLECVPRCQAYSNLITELLLGGELVGSESTPLWQDDRLPLTLAKKFLANDCITASCQRNMSPQALCQSYKQQTWTLRG